MEEEEAEVEVDKEDEEDDLEGEDFGFVVEEVGESLGRVRLSIFEGG